MYFQELFTLFSYAGHSLARMFIALAISVFFALAYGILAARRRRAAKVLLPILDILQSIPILGFFPAAILFFVGVLGEGAGGLEAAAIFLIFTSMAWNMAFAVYEAVSNIPKELEEASDSFRLHGFLRLKREIVPVCVPKLVYNGIMSWAGGWYFLVASEIISLGSKSYKLPGIGSFIGEAAYAGDISLALEGLITLVFTILLIDLLLWRPLELYANRFKYEFAAPHEVSAKGFFFVPHFIARFPMVIPSRTAHAVHAVLARLFSAISGIASTAYHVLQPRGVLLVVSAFGIVLTLYSILQYRPAQITEFVPPTITEGERSLISSIPLGLGFSAARILLAYLISVAWTLPLGVFIARRQRLFNVAMPAFESAASLPATALFPFIFVLLIGLPIGQELSTLILLLTGMQWYLLFNIIGGVRSIPEDINEAAKAFNLRGSKYWRSILLPAIFPSFITGSITAWGGGWNALIVSEYISFGGKTYSTLGIGSLLDVATYEVGSVTVMLAAIVAMGITVVALNRLVWRKMFRKASLKYAFNY